MLIIDPRSKLTLASVGYMMVLYKGKNSMKLTTKELQKMAKYFLKKYFDNIPYIPCKFLPKSKFEDGCTAYFIIQESDDYDSGEDELYNTGEYSSHYVEIDDGIGFTCGGGSFADPLNHPDLAIALSNELRTDVNKCVGVLLHELVHYYCWYIGYDHSDGSHAFENKLAELGLPSNYENMFNKETKEWEDIFDYSKMQNYYNEYRLSIST